MQIYIIAACARNRVIGINGTLPWSIPRDWAYFLGKVKGHMSIMGRVSAQEYPIGPDHPAIIVSRSMAQEKREHVDIVSSYKEAIALAEAKQLPEVWICGGASIYEESLATAHKLFLTRVELDVDGDTRFPAWQQHFDVLESREEYDEDNIRFAFEVWTKSTFVV
ncbi:Aste57867_23057 [Aphanomyces stellatus]|uniref:dihydrofolate reductase n=1 Tax=Aphanomyces stellatus TaxID=120398 RepID=A0A485LLW6_9STRA|nr:hypothetical protein As57867_022986 [Aphanomyces stellatus]VFT99705.1 Aste57867_23057 [Aphanomyces stellatus]